MVFKVSISKNNGFKVLISKDNGFKVSISKIIDMVPTQLQRLII